MIKRLALPLLGSVFLLFGAACGTSVPDVPSDYYVNVRVSSVASGGGVKLNGMLAGALPGNVQLDVDESGAVTKQYVIALSTNVMSGARGVANVSAASGASTTNAAGDSFGADTEGDRYTLRPGDYPPASINFDRNGPVVSGTAQVMYRGTSQPAM